ncbi:hypothetical protein LSAT2_006070 [Lamellibrachia satsuma]|nr:hypothetical protein LSAT2_006070 [Lamellibrachia satsuma]
MERRPARGCLTLQPPNVSFTARFTRLPGATSGDIEGVVMATAQLRVIVTRAIDPFNFWARIGTDASLAQFDEFENLVDDYCSAFEATHEQCGPLRTNQLILVKCSTTGRWRRAVVVSVDSEADEVDVFYVDYSTTEFVPLTSIVDVVPSHFEAFPRQAWKFTLTGMKPIAQIWISRAVSYFTTLVLGQQHDVQLLHMDGATVVVDILIREGEKVTSLSSLLVSEGFALPVTLNGDDSTKGCSVPTFDLQSLASQMALKKVDDEEAAGDSDKPNIEQELFTKGIDCSEVGTYSGCSDFDLIAGVPRSPCDTIGDIRSQIQFMTENTEKLAQKDEIRSPPRHQRSKHSEEPTAQKARTGRPPRFAEWVEEGGKRNSSPRTRRRGLIQTEEGREHDGRHSNKGQRNRHTSPDPLKQGNHPSPGLLRKGKDHDSPDRLRKEHRHSPDPLRQGKPHSPALLRHGNRHTSPDRLRKGNRHTSPDPLRKGNRHTSPDVPRQGSRDTSPDHRGGNFGDGDGSYSKALIKPKSSKKRDKLKGKPPLPTSPEQRQNEYDWHSCQFTFKVGKILEDFTEETCPSKSRELHKLLSAVSPQLQDLPGDGAVYLCLDTIVRTAITDKIPIDLAVKLVESLSGFDEFPDILRNLLLKYHGTTIKVTTATKTKLQCRNFVFFLAMLFNRASRWEDSDAVTDCIISSLNKWAVFNTKATQSDRHGTSELFSECLCDFISVGGTALEHHFPDDNETLFKCIREKVLSNDVPRPVKEKMLQLLVNQHLTASATQGVDTNVVTMETVAVTTATKKIQTEETVRVKTANSAIQVELLPCASSSSDQSALRRASCGLEVDSVKSSDRDPCDPYGRVKVMLSDLRLEELLDLFHSNAVRVCRGHLKNG